MEPFDSSLDFDDFTEFDEQVGNRDKALVIIESKVKEYLRGEESLGVVDAYIASGIRVGVTSTEIANIWREARKCL